MAFVLKMMKKFRGTMDPNNLKEISPVTCREFCTIMPWRLILLNGLFIKCGSVNINQMHFFQEDTLFKAIIHQM